MRKRNGKKKKKKEKKREKKTARLWGIAQTTAVFLLYP